MVNIQQNTAPSSDAQAGSAHHTSAHHTSAHHTSAHHTSGQLLLVRSLEANAVLSLVTGLIFVTAGPRVADWLQAAGAGDWLRLFGAALIAHAAVLSWAKQHASVATWARLNLVVIAPYPLLLGALMLAGFVGGATGIALGVADALAVATLAVLQLLGLSRSAAA